VAKKGRNDPGIAASLVPIGQSFCARNTCPVVQLMPPGLPLEDGRMSEVTFIAPRRSGRVFHKMRVKAQGRDHDGRKFREVCETLVVNSHGGLLILKNEIDQGEMLVLTNPDTDEEQECRVVFLGEAGDRGQRVGVEFLSPAPRFWGVEFNDSSSN
jgi:hypothetical protein